MRARLTTLSIAFLLVFALSLPGCSTRPPISRAGCNAPAAVEAAMENLPDALSDCWWRASCWREKISVYRALRDRYPRELTAHRALVTLLSWAPEELPERDALRKDLTRQYEEDSRRYPKNPAYPYLLARLEENFSKRRALLEQSLVRDPNFPWAHEQLAQMLRKPNEKQKAEAARHVEAFARACPGRITQILSLLSRVEDRRLWETHASALEKIVRPEKPPYANLSSLWELQFKFAEPAAYPALRAKVSQQVATLRRLDRASDRKWLSALQTGYKILGDEPGIQWADEARLARFPCTSEATHVLLERQKKARGAPPQDDGKPKEDWYAQAFSDLRPQLSRCPNEPLLWEIALSDLDQWKSSPRDVVEATGERVLTLVGNRAAGRVAETYLDRSVRLNEVNGLLGADRRAIDMGWKERQAYGLEGDELREWTLFHQYDVAKNQVSRIRLALTARDSASAVSELKDLSDTLTAAEKNATRPTDRPITLRQRAEFWKLTAEADSLQGKSEEALLSYRRSLENDPKDAKVLDAARSLFVRMRGSENGFTEWKSEVERIAAASSEEVTRTVHRPLPQFRLADLSGRQWTEHDLQGKVVAMNFWATWCGFCLDELPHFQKLAEKYRDRKDMLFVTISVDDNPGLIEPFLRKEKYTFPVLIGGPGSFSSWAPTGIPLTYVVDPTGSIVREQLGFGGDGERWKAEMEQYLAAAIRSRSS